MKKSMNIYDIEISDYNEVNIDINSDMKDIKHIIDNYKPTLTEIDEESFIEMTIYTDLENKAELFNDNDVNIDTGMNFGTGYYELQIYGNELIDCIELMKQDLIVN